MFILEKRKNDYIAQVKEQGEYRDETKKDIRDCKCVKEKKRQLRR